MKGNQKGTINDLLGQDLKGWSLYRGYYAILRHGLAGTFPLIRKDTDEVVFCLDLDVLVMVLQKVMPKGFELFSVLLLVKNSENFGFNLDLDSNQEKTPLSILTQNEFDGLTQGGENPFKWAPGLMGAGVKQEYYERMIEREVARMRGEE